MNEVARRWAFIALSTTIMVFFSEKMYWYIQGYHYALLVLVYLFGTYSFLLAISYFRIKEFWPMVLAATLFPLYVEGLFTGIITSDPTGIMFAYFIGWHTTLSILIGWYWHHRLLTQGRRRTLAWSSIALGAFLGMWATTFWLPENVNDPEFIAEGFRTGQWPIADYALLLLYLGAIYVLSHYLIGKVWDSEFTPSKLENSTILLVLGVFLAGQFLTYSVLALFLVALYSAILLVLKKYRSRAPEGSILDKLRGEVRLVDTLLLLLLPLTSVLTYAVVYAADPAEEVIRLFMELTVFIQVTYGAVLLIYSIYATLKSQNNFQQLESYQPTSSSFSPDR